jgi:hypothetical protein
MEEAPPKVFNFNKTAFLTSKIHVFLFFIFASQRVQSMNPVYFFG